MLRGVRECLALPGTTVEVALKSRKNAPYFLQGGLDALSAFVVRVLDVHILETLGFFFRGLR